MVMSNSGMKQRLHDDMTAALKARDEIRKSTLRMALTAVTKEEVAGKEARELSDAEVVDVLSSEAKKRRETIASTGAAELGPRGIGKVMGALQPKIKGKADGGVVSAEVKRQLGA